MLVSNRKRIFGCLEVKRARRGSSQQYVSECSVATVSVVVPRVGARNVLATASMSEIAELAASARARPLGVRMTPRA